MVDAGPWKAERKLPPACYLGWRYDELRYKVAFSTTEQDMNISPMVTLKKTT